MADNLKKLAADGSVRGYFKNTSGMLEPDQEWTLAFWYRCTDPKRNTSDSWGELDRALLSKRMVNPNPIEFQVFAYQHGSQPYPSNNAVMIFNVGDGTYDNFAPVSSDYAPPAMYAAQPDPFDGDWHHIVLRNLNLGGTWVNQLLCDGYNYMAELAAANPTYAFLQYGMASGTAKNGAHLAAFTNPYNDAQPPQFEGGWTADNADIDEVVIFDKALSDTEAAEIRATYDLAASSVSSNISLWSRMGDGAGDTSTLGADQSGNSHDFVVDSGSFGFIDPSESLFSGSVVSANSFLTPDASFVELFSASEWTDDKKVVPDDFSNPSASHFELFSASEWVDDKKVVPDDFSSPSASHFELFSASEWTDDKKVVPDDFSSPDFYSSELFGNDWGDALDQSSGGSAPAFSGDEMLLEVKNTSGIDQLISDLGLLVKNGEELALASSESDPALPFEPEDIRRSLSLRTAISQGVLSYRLDSSDSFQTDSARQAGGEPAYDGEELVVAQFEEDHVKAAALTAASASIASIEAGSLSLPSYADVKANLDGLEAHKAQSEADIDALETLTAAHTASIATNAADIGSNDTDIAANAAAIQSNDADIAANASAISTHSSAGTHSADKIQIAGAGSFQKISTSANTAESALAAVDGLLDALMDDPSGATVAAVAPTFASRWGDFAGAVDTNIPALTGVIGNASSGLTKDVSDNSAAIAVNAGDISAIESVNTTQGSDISSNAASIATLNAPSSNPASVAGQVAAEAGDRAAADGLLDGRLDIIEGAAVAGQLDKSLLGVKEQMQSEISTERGRLDSILQGADGALDSFKEIQDWLGDTLNPSAQGLIEDDLLPRMTAAEALLSGSASVGGVDSVTQKVAAEAAIRSQADTDVNDRIDDLEQAQVNMTAPGGNLASLYGAFNFTNALQYMEGEATNTALGALAIFGRDMTSGAASSGGVAAYKAALGLADAGAGSLIKMAEEAEAAIAVLNDSDANASSVDGKVKAERLLREQADAGIVQDLNNHISAYNTEKSATQAERDANAAAAAANLAAIAVLNGDTSIPTSVDKKVDIEKQRALIAEAANAQAAADAQTKADANESAIDALALQRVADQLRVTDSGAQLSSERMTMSCGLRGIVGNQYAEQTAGIPMNQSSEVFMHDAKVYKVGVQLSAACSGDLKVHVEHQPASGSAVVHTVTVPSGSSSGVFDLNISPASGDRMQVRFEPTGAAVSNPVVSIKYAERF